MNKLLLPLALGICLQLARLYDEGGGDNEIQVLQKSIQAAYQPGFQTLTEALTAIAKPYAERHGIKVRWDVKTSPTE